ncbi:MAG: hypothetical protein IAI49_09090 [Candidatus Eremiobacteraeota bacterium]|nr:hypothetical protein [Candidatus Eremiobacteraeota bacterium]
MFPLSVLGIENAIDGAERRVSEYARGDLRFDDGPIAYSVIAIRDWERRYPNDPWIAKDLLALTKFYAHVGTREARDLATRAAGWLQHDYPHVAYADGASTVLAELAAGDRAPVPVAEALAAPPNSPPLEHQLPRLQKPRRPEPRETLPAYAHYETPRP